MYSHLRQTVKQKVPKYNLGGFFSQMGGMFNSGSKFGNLMNGWGEKLSGQNSQMSEETMGKVSNIIDLASQAGNAFNQFGNNLLTAKDQDENTSLKSTLSGAVKNIASGNWTAAVGNVANKGLDMLEDGLMGDKNFNQQSEAIDNATRAVSKELMKTGPWGLLAAGVIESLNFVDKAAGKTVQGFEVGNVGSGYGGVQTEQATSSFRGSQTRNMKREMARRAEQVNMALAANQVNEDQRFELTARMNSIDNVMQANQIALAGGLETSLLGG